MMTNHKILCIIRSGLQASFASRPRLRQPLLTNFHISPILKGSTMCNFHSSGTRFSNLIMAAIAISISVFAETAKADDGAAGAGLGMTTLLVALLAVAAGTAFLFWRKSKNSGGKSQYDYTNRVQNYSSAGNYDEGVDAAMELAWFKKASGSTKKAKKKVPAVQLPASVPSRTAAPPRSSSNELRLNTLEFQEKMKKMQFGQLPINSFLQLTEPREIEPLPFSDDPSLLNAIEQTNEVFEEDEAVRDLALRILARFTTQNSVEALSQIALYDLSSNLRSKAVTTLTEFDHESVFETILLACADPTREVRAAAARGLFRLNFDRADAWKRIITSKDDFRMSHAARAATESGIVAKSFDRLLHDEMKIAYEAFALVGLLIKAGETQQIFEAIRENKDERIKLALLHVLSVVKDDRALIELNNLRIETTLPSNVAAKVKETVENYNAVMA